MNNVFMCYCCIISTVVIYIEYYIQIIYIGIYYTYTLYVYIYPENIMPIKFL